MMEKISSTKHQEKLSSFLLTFISLIFSEPSGLDSGKSLDMLEKEIALNSYFFEQTVPKQCYHSASSII